MWKFENVKIKFEMMHDLRYNARRIGANQRRASSFTHFHIFQFPH